MSEKKELSLEELEEVTGGVNYKRNCIYFIQAEKKNSARRCMNCFYYNKNKLGVYTCTHPARNGVNETSGVI